MQFVQWNFNKSSLKIQDIIHVESSIKKGKTCIKLKKDKNDGKFTQTITFDGINVYVTDSITVRYRKVNGQFTASFGVSVPTSPSKRKNTTMKESNKPIRASPVVHDVTTPAHDDRGSTSPKVRTTRKAKISPRKRFKIPKKAMSPVAQSAYVRRSTRDHTSFNRRNEEQALMNKDTDNAILDDPKEFNRMLLNHPRIQGTLKEVLSGMRKAKNAYIKTNVLYE